MTKITRLATFVMLAILLSGCAHLPDATIGYYLPKSEVRFRVVRTVACDANDNLIVVNSSTPIVTHSADRERFGTIRLSELRGLFSDTDVKFEFYEDGRLKSVNSTITGQGETILKTVVTIAAGVFLKAGTSEECKFIKDAGGSKPLTLTYEGKIDISTSADKKQIVPPDTASSFYASKLANAIGGVFAVVEGSEVPTEAPLSYAAQNGDVLLKARQPGLVKVKVMTGGINDRQGNAIWEGELAVAQFGKDYSIPIPAPAIFGKQVLIASFQESGALSSVQYASTTGAGQALNVANSALTALQGETTAQKAANVKAEADLIAQQQRLAQCLANPTSCK
jgi:hypothetical protein